MARVGRRTWLLPLALAVAAGAGLSLAMAAGEPTAPRSGASGNPSAEPSPPTGSAPRSRTLLPNLRSLRADDLRVQRVRGGRLLRFSASLGNFGPGPLLLRPRPEVDGCPPGEHPAAQVVHHDANNDGGYQPGIDVAGRERPAGCMLAHPTHDHWHFDAMAGYSLSSPATGQRLAVRRKVSFCLRDNLRIDGVGTDVRREHFGECTRSGPQGISPGWVDVYLWDLPGQALPLPPGRGRQVLCLGLTADPRDLLVETDEGDNATSVTVVVQDDLVRRGSPRRCDATAG